MDGDRGQVLKQRSPVWAAGDVPHALASPCTPESSCRAHSLCCVVCTHSCLPWLQAGRRSGTAEPGLPSTPAPVLPQPRPSPVHLRTRPPQSSPRLVPALPGKAPTVCQPCPLVSFSATTTRYNPDHSPSTSGADVQSGLWCDCFRQSLAFTPGEQGRGRIQAQRFARR